MSTSTTFNVPQYNESLYNSGSSASLGSLGHIKIGGIPFVIAYDTRANKHQFGRDQAPSFVNKIGSGDPTYRDSSFFPHWAQINWKNGSKQEYFDDGGKFFTSKNVNVTEETKITLSKLGIAVGNPVATTTITCFDIDCSDGNKVFIGAENGHVYRLDPSDESITDLGAVDGTQRVNCILYTKIGGPGARAANSGQMLVGVGTLGTGTAKIFRYDGSFTLCDSSTKYDAVTSLAEYGDSVYAAYGKTAMVKKSNVENFRTITAPTAPTVAVAAGGSVDAGDHYYRVTYVTSNGETELGTASLVATTGANKTVNLSNIPVAPAADKVTARRIYRTKAGGSKYYLDGTISDNTTTTYSSTKADADLASTDSTNRENETAWNVNKDIDYPGYIWKLIPYNGKLYAVGGHPENDSAQLFNGTLWSYDAYAWLEVFPFKHTVIKSAEVYDSLLFLGTIHGHLYVYNTASVDLLFKFPEGTSIYDMKVYDDKLYLSVSQRDGTGDNHSLYVFDRAGISMIYSEPSNIKPRALIVSGDDLLMGGYGNGKIYRIDPTRYHASGELQSSYFDANLPSIQKLWVEAIIEMDALPEGTKVEIYYKTDESDTSWTKIDETTLTGIKLARFALPKDVTATKFSWKVVLYSNTAKTLTPTIRKVIIKYVLQPDFYYLWRMRIACPDNMVWLDNSEPVGLLTESTQPGDTVINVSPSIGFPNPNGSTRMYASIINKETGEVNEISYTGVSGSTLIGCSGVMLHDLNTNTFEVRICGRHFHHKILEFKQDKSLLEYVDIDGIKYTVLFYNYSEDNWVLNTGGGLENEVPITLLQA